MRNCGNCYNGHYNLSERGEEMYCDESEFMEEKVEESYCCEYHRFCPGSELEKNYIFYDDSCDTPGFLIVNIEDKKITKFFKIYEATEGYSPTFAVRVYSKNDENNIEFSFRDIEDDENGLYDCFTNLYHNLSGKELFSMDSSNQSKNKLILESNSKVTKLVFIKDLNSKISYRNDCIDILIGNSYSCTNYDAIFDFYQNLSKVCVKKLSQDKVKKLLLTK